MAKYKFIRVQPDIQNLGDNAQGMGSMKVARG